METRKLYIIASLIVLVFITGLSFWYLYLAKQGAQIGDVSELQFPKDRGGITTNNSSDLIPINQAGDDTTTYGDIHNQDASQPLDSSPFGSSSDSTGGSNDINNTLNNNGEGVKNETTPESWSVSQLHSAPVASMHIITINNNDDKDAIIIQFSERKTGHIFESTVKGEKYRISGITLPRTSASYFLPDNKVLVVSESKGVPTLITTNTKEATETPSMLTGNIIQIAQQNNTIYYTTISQLGGINLRSVPSSKLDTSGTTNTHMWSSPLSGWVIQPLTNSITVTQKSSYNIPGYAYFINKTNGSATPLLQDKPGLITNASPDAKRVLYSTSGSSGVRLYLKDTSIDDKPIELSIKTLASKCLWGNDSVTFYCAIPNYLPSELPDSWYKGLEHFNDSLWRINAATGDAFRLAQATGLDIIDMHEGEGVLVFKNKIDQSLWIITKEQ